MEAISGTRSVLVPNLIQVKNSNGKMSVPVQPYVARYIQFKHIVGIPAQGDSSRVSVSRLVALDNLIDKFISKSTESVVPGNNTNQNAEQIINSLEKQTIDHVITGGIKNSGTAAGMGVFLDTWA